MQFLKIISIKKIKGESSNPIESAPMIIQHYNYIQIL